MSRSGSYMCMSTDKPPEGAPAWKLTPGRRRTPQPTPEPEALAYVPPPEEPAAAKKPAAKKKAKKKASKKKASS